MELKSCLTVKIIIVNRVYTVRLPFLTGFKCSVETISLNLLRCREVTDGKNNHTFSIHNSIPQRRLSWKVCADSSRVNLFSENIIIHLEYFFSRTFALLTLLTMLAWTPFDLKNALAVLKQLVTNVIMRIEPFATYSSITFQF